VSIGTAILVVGVLSLFVLGPPWFRKVCIVLAVVAGVGTGVMVIYIGQPQWWQQLTRQAAWTPPASDPVVPTCTAEQMTAIEKSQQVKPWLLVQHGHLFTPTTAPTSDPLGVRWARTATGGERGDVRPREIFI
jgi:hypothetical protein